MTTILTGPVPYALSPVAIEDACGKIVAACGHYTTAYTLIVGKEQVMHAVRMLAVMPRVGLVVDDGMDSCEWKLATVTPALEVFAFHSEGC